MANPVSLKFPDGSVRSYDAATTGGELAESISKSLAKKAVAYAHQGVLRDLSGCMAAEGISMAQVLQKSGEGQDVPLVFMTHETTAQAMSDALQRTLDAGLLKEPAVYFRVLGGE